MVIWYASKQRCSMRTPEPVTLKLAFYEANYLRGHLIGVCAIKLKPQTSNDVIVLAEYFEKFQSACASHGLRRPDKVVPYRLPLSVARIFHERLLSVQYCDACQSILSKLDQQLTNRGLKPIQPIKIQ